MKSIAIVLFVVLFSALVVCIDLDGHTQPIVNGEYTPIKGMNAKARYKHDKALKGKNLKKSVGDLNPREDMWKEARIDPNLGYVPMERYETAYEQLKSMVSPRATSSSWSNIGPLTNKVDGGRTRGLVSLGNSVLVAGSVAGGIWRSTNGGSSWTPVGSNMARMTIGTIAKDPTNSNTLYAGTGEGIPNADARSGLGIYKSTDAGVTWSLMTGTNVNNFAYVNKIVGSSTTGIMYAATWKGIFSLSSGTWTQILAASSSDNLGYGMLDVAVSPGNPDTIIAWNSQVGLLVSTDGGSNWTLKFGSSSGSNSYFRGSIAVAPSNTSVIYSTQSNLNGKIQGVYRSNNRGVSWSNVLNTNTGTIPGAMNALIFSNPVYGFTTTSGSNCFNTTVQALDQGWYDNAIAVDPLNANIVYVGGIDLWRSDDGGVTFGLISAWWVDSALTSYLHADNHVITFSPDYSTDNTMYMGNDGGVFKTTNGRTGTKMVVSPCAVTTTVAWTPLNEGYGTLQYYHGDVGTNGERYVGGTQDNGVWSYSTGTEWANVWGGDGGYCQIDKQNPSRIYLSNTYMDIYRFNLSTGGYYPILQTGYLSGGNGRFINPYVMDPTRNARLFTCNSYLWSIDNVNTNSPSYTSLGYLGASISALAIYDDGTRIYMGATSGAYFVANKNSGGSWSVTTGGSPCSSCFIYGLAFQSNNKDIVYAAISTFGKSHLWKSTNGGTSWSTLGNIPDVPCLSVFVLPTSQNNNIFVGTDLGVLLSDDGGQTFSYVDSSTFPPIPVERYSYQGTTNTLFAWTHARGVYTSNPVGGTTGDLTTASSDGHSMVRLNGMVALIGVAIMFLLA